MLSAAHRPFSGAAVQSSADNGGSRAAGAHGRDTPAAHGEVGFAEDLSECGGLLQFYMPVTFDPDAVFGTHVATAENDDWLNVYAAYDLNASRPCSALDVILVCGDGNEFAFRYPLAKQEQAALLEKMDAYCLEQTGMALADFRARYLVEEPQPHQAPSLAQM